MPACTVRVAYGPAIEGNRIEDSVAPLHAWRCDITPPYRARTVPMPLTSGDRYAGFTITEFLGSTPTCSRYRCIDSETGATTHLTVLITPQGSGPRRESQFRRTNKILMRADIPGIARILRFEVTPQRQWVATEFISGMDSEALLQQRFSGGMPHQSLCLIADHIARAVDEASGHQVLHGDITPAAILLADPFSKNYRIVITDFGQRYATGAPPNASYAAPETLADGNLATDRSDQFALAATMFHLLTGRAPFDGPARPSTPDGTARFDAQTLKQVGTAPDGLDRVFARAFALDPGDRFRSCQEFVEALVTPSRARPVTAPKAPRTAAAAKPPARLGRRAVAAAAVVVVAAAVVGTAIAVWPSEGPEPAQPARTPVAAGPGGDPAPAAQVSACQQLDTALAGLSLRQKLAQTLMVGVTDAVDARAVVEDQHVGGIFIASWTDLDLLTSGDLLALQQGPRPIPLAVSVDEEGGRVQRLKSLIGAQASPRQLVADGMSTQQVYDIAYERGRKMRDYGITIDFAPVVDVTGAPDDTVIGDRSFADDPTTVTAYAGAYAHGLRDAGLLPVLKHFPGHGRASGDSHQNGVTTPAIDELMGVDVIPYRTLTTERPVGVMLGHMEVPGLTGTDPASLSAAAYDLLRQGGYGGPPFDGPIFTDDLSSMGAITLRYNVPDAVLKALQAGADTALWITTDEVPAVLDRLEQAVRGGELSTTRVDDAVRQMAVTKDPGLACTG
ncbi:hypothetical protein GCM10010409_05160 [Mycolicibacterium diernhoferi]